MEERVMSYMVAEESSASKLEATVQRLLDEGWELQGGLSVASPTQGVWWYFQALVRYTRDGEQ